MIPTSKETFLFYGGQRAGKTTTFERLRIEARINEDRRTYARWSRRTKLQVYGVVDPPLTLTREGRMEYINPGGGAWRMTRRPRPGARLVNERRAAAHRRIWRRIYRSIERRDRQEFRARPDPLPVMTPPSAFIEARNRQMDHLADSLRYSMLDPFWVDESDEGIDWRQVRINLAAALLGSIATALALYLWFRYN